MSDHPLHVEYVPIISLKPAEYNPRRFSETDKEQLKKSITSFGVVDPILVNAAENRKNIVIGGNFRLTVLKELGHENVPVVFLNIPDLEKEKELNIRLNRNQGEFDYTLLAEFDQSFLEEAGFSSEELDKIFEEDPVEEQFDLEHELEKLNIDEITVKKGDVYEINGSKIMCGDSTIEADMLKLMGNDKADMVMTDPPYILDYLKGKTRHGEATVGFGTKKNRRYLETETLPDNFTELWMNNVAKVQAKDFSIICYENWKNTRTIWNEMEKHWKVKNMIIWNTPNRNQGYSSKYKFFSKYDIAMVASTEDKTLNIEPEEGLFDNEYQTALFAISGHPQWESYEKGKKYCPTDFIQHNTADEKSSGQAIIFGVKPVQILIPYIKVLTKRGQIVLEPYGGSGSTCVASMMLGRRCFLMEKSPVYAEVILARVEKYSGKKRVKING